ncbi:MAG TPA: peptide ABC transporter permease [Pseudolabrys sp.]|jgi:hypothetical protein|nr:peptide ABC transporter permease [Pseudolabrys sp.]
MAREGPAQRSPPLKNGRDDEPPSYPASKTRGADIVLRKRWQRWVFVGGLVAAVVLALIVRWLAG